MNVRRFVVGLDVVMISCAVVVVGSFLSCGCSSAAFDVATPGELMEDAPEVGDDSRAVDPPDADDEEDTRRGVRVDAGADEGMVHTDSGAETRTDSGISAADTETDTGTDATKDAWVDVGASDSTTVTDGCTPNVHHDGLGGTFLDCAPVGAWSLDLAMKAARSGHGNNTTFWVYEVRASDVACGGSQVAVYPRSCPNSDGGVGCSCAPPYDVHGWVFAGPNAGKVFSEWGGNCGCDKPQVTSWD